MQHYKTTGISIPVELMKRIDNERGDVSRSRYVLRLLEMIYGPAKEIGQEQK
ncbi:MAG: hypothetical protein M3Y53_01500 [Thermoproteota archaeon]|nr:hypothetical protein [Thermoproteota archaeon]